MSAASERCNSAQASRLGTAEECDTRSRGMKHLSSQTLFAHWNDRRGSRPAPERGEIDPGAIKVALADSFILSFNQLTNHPFRLAGTRVCALFGRELKGQGFVELWDRPKQRQINDLAAIVADEQFGIVAGAVGWTVEGFSVDLELLLLPLKHCGRTHVRLIGTLAPLAVPYWLGSSPVHAIALGSHRYLGPSAEALSRLCRSKRAGGFVAACSSLTAARRKTPRG
jgi:hypothetical protein